MKNMFSCISSSLNSCGVWHCGIKEQYRVPVLLLAMWINIKISSLWIELLKPWYHAAFTLVSKVNTLWSWWWKWPRLSHMFFCHVFFFKSLNLFQRIECCLFLFVCLFVLFESEHVTLCCVINGTSPEEIRRPVNHKCQTGIIHIGPPMVARGRILCPAYDFVWLHHNY